MSADTEMMEETRALHFNTLVIDGLQPAPLTPEHFARLRRGGVNVLNHTAVSIDSDFSQAALQIAALHRNVAEHSDQVMLVLRGVDIERARREGKVGIIIGMQNGLPIMDKVEYVQALHVLGVRVIQLTYNARNLIGDGCCEPANAGLSNFGRQVVAEMNRCGMLIDLSHCGQRTTIEAIEASADPVVISHANALALTPSVRNKSAEVMKLLADHGGVIGAVMWSPLNYRDPQCWPGLSEYFEHIDYLVEHAGIDHVGIGTDFGEAESREYYDAAWPHGGGPYPEVTAPLGEWYCYDTRIIDDIGSLANFWRITEGLLKRGYKDEDVRKIIGGNLHRVMTQVFDA